LTSVASNNTTVVGECRVVDHGHEQQRTIRSSAPLLTSVGSNNTTVVDDRYVEDHRAQDRGFMTSTAQSASQARLKDSRVQALLIQKQRVSC
jgi:hypothetical protein